MLISNLKVSAVFWQNFGGKAFESCAHDKDNLKLFLTLVLVYEVHVYTGAKPGAETDSKFISTSLGQEEMLAKGSSTDLRIIM